MRTGDLARPGARVVAAPAVFVGAPQRRGDPARLVREGAVALDGDRVVEVGPRREVEARHGRAEWVDAVLLPAMVNAHTHLELSHLRGRITGGEGLGAWVQLLLAARAREAAPAEALEDAVAELVAAGVAAVGEVTNSLAALPHLARAGVAGTVYHEVFGFSEERIATALAAAHAMREGAAPAPGLAVAPSPHAVYSTHPRVVAELLRAGPASIHLAEDPDERSFCAEGKGSFAVMNRALGSTDLPRLGRSAVAAAAPHLGPRSLVVHAVDLDDEDRRALAATGATVVLCPRSNRHIGGRVADLPALLAAGVPLAIGTDSLASSPSLSPLAELAELAHAFPQLDPARLLPLAWNGRCVGAPGVGQLAPGACPGIVAAPGDPALLSADPAAWLLREFALVARPLRWIARHRPEGAR